MKHPHISELARAARERTGLSRAKFAALLWTGTRVVAKWEDGENEPAGTIQLMLHEIRDGFMPTVARP